jgi:hypothetical protein
VTDEAVTLCVCVEFIFIVYIGIWSIRHRKIGTLVNSSTFSVCVEDLSFVCARSICHTAETQPLDSRGLLVKHF